MLNFLTTPLSSPLMSALTHPAVQHLGLLLSDNILTVTTDFGGEWRTAANISITNSKDRKYTRQQEWEIFNRSESYCRADLLEFTCTSSLGEKSQNLNTKSGHTWKWNVFKLTAFNEMTNTWSLNGLWEKINCVKNDTITCLVNLRYYIFLNHIIDFSFFLKNNGTFSLN